MPQTSRSPRRRSVVTPLMMLRLSLIASVVAATLLALALVATVRSKEATQNALASRLVETAENVERLDERNEGLIRQVEGLVSEREELLRRLDQSYAPVEIGGMVDFPVSRGMAREGDTLSRFASREKTTPEVIRALNPHLKPGDVALTDRQMLWIPKR